MRKLNNKGFSLIELLGSLVILVLIMCIGAYSARGTLSTTLTTLDTVSQNEIKDATEMYIVENTMTWINNGDEYTCLTVNNLVDKGYFEDMEVESYKDKKIKVIRDSNTRVVKSINIVDNCE